MNLTPSGRRLRVFINSQLYLRDSVLILLGRSKPLIRFEVEATPPSVYYNFEILPEKRAAFERDLDLPLPLAPIRCIGDEEPFHCLTLNMYRVSGLANGIRAEWSAYVRDSGGNPRYLVVEARGDRGALDPDRLITRGVHVTHELSGDRLSGEVLAEDGGLFEVAIDGVSGGTPVSATPEWVEANDYIYWRSGVCDRTFYDSGLANARARRIPNENVTIEDGTRWSQFVDPTPKHVVVFDDAIEFAMSPWWNLSDLRPAG